LPEKLFDTRIRKCKSKSNFATHSGVKIRNFLFHRVNPVRETLWDPMDVKLFDRCLAFIARHYHVVLLENLLSERIDTPKKPYATIGFDDGYKDNIEYAAPILEKHRLFASFYVVTDCIDRNIPTWTHSLDHAFEFTAKSKIDLSFDFLPEALHVSDLPDHKARMEYIRKLKPAIKKISHRDRNVVMNAVAKAFDDVSIPRFMMNWEDLKQLQTAGHYIGSHTVTHGMMATMASEEDIKNELVLSGEKIREHLGYFPKTISYPLGSYDKRVIRFAKDAGYQFGLAVKQDIYRSDEDDLFEIPRIELYNEPWLKTRMRISNSLEDIKKIIRYR
jgi:peptidoglycan/xylan/chitin deacetylase (PgdA/CDA1 family)